MKEARYSAASKCSLGAIRIIETENPRDDALIVMCGEKLAQDYNRVMPVFDDESVYFARTVACAAQGKTLDIGSGSGILSMAAAQSGCLVTGVEINPLAIRYAKASSVLSGLNLKCDFLEGDLFTPVNKGVYDTIMMNPPFVPLPFGFKMFLSADGGPDGMRIVKQVLDGLDAHLAKEGRFLLLTMSLGDEQEPLVYQQLRPVFQKRKARIKTTHIYERTRIEAEPFFKLFESVSTYAEWRRFLAKERLTHLYYMLHEVEPNGRFEHIEIQNTIPFAQTELSGSWAGRLNRFQRWFEAKAKNAADGVPGCKETKGVLKASKNQTAPQAIKQCGALLAGLPD